ncbi:hypothetical protein JMG10_03875 [Nostoc ellipsosporum NOK]|jgi:hypothetical protein|nr:hypothetical protein [Nostoc ellipsosporum NOK]
MATRRGSQRGFASMDPERRRRIAQKGGQSSHGGRSREQDYDEYEEDYDDYDDYDEVPVIANTLCPGSRP